MTDSYAYSSSTSQKRRRENTPTDRPDKRQRGGNSLNRHRENTPADRLDKRRRGDDLFDDDFGGGDTDGDDFDEDNFRASGVGSSMTERANSSSSNRRPPRKEKDTARQGRGNSTLNAAKYIPPMEIA
jgi:hypothetical protein